jgi:UDP-glucose 4-epimerase
MSEADCTEFVHGLDAIGHFAQSNAPAISDRHWPSDLVSNIGATLNLLEALRRRGDRPCHFLFASSGGAVYGQNNPVCGLYSEDAPCHPLSPYGIQKLSIEHYLHLASKQGWLTATVLRFSNVYGSILSPERRQGLIGVSISRILEGQKVQIFGSEETVRDYVHVDDVIRAVIQGLFQTEPFQIFNIGAGVGHSVREVLEILERVSKRPVLKEASDFGKNSFRLTPRVVLSIEKARRELGWVPKISLEDGIATLWKSALASHGK